MRGSEFQPIATDDHRHISINDIPVEFSSDIILSTAI